MGIVGKKVIDIKFEMEEAASARIASCCAELAKASALVFSFVILPQSAVLFFSTKCKLKPNEKIL